MRTSAATDTIELDDGRLIHGFVDDGYGPVMDAFLANFRDRHELGASCAVYRGGVTVAELWGGIADARTGHLDMPQHGVRRAPFATANTERVAADAAGEADPPGIAVDETAIAAGKDEQRHQVGAEIGPPEVSLEGKQVGAAMRNGARGR